MALTRAAYAVADALASQDPEAARRLRKAAVSVPARLAGALSAEDASAREFEVAEARAALAEVVERARTPADDGGGGGAGDAADALVRRARTLELSVADGLGRPELAN